MNMVSWQALLLMLFNPRAWVYIIASPLSCALFYCLAATLAFKMQAWLRIDESLRRFWDVPAILSLDIFFCMALVATTYIGPYGRSWVKWPIRVLGGWLLASTAVDLAHLYLKGAPVKISVLHLAAQPLRDSVEIVSEALFRSPVDTLLIFGVLLLVHLTTKLVMWEDPTPPELPPSDGDEANEPDPIQLKLIQQRARETRLLKAGSVFSPLLWSILAGLVWIATPLPKSESVAKLVYNGTFGTLTSFELPSIEIDWGDDEPVYPTSIDYGRLVDASMIQDNEKRFDVLLVILESTGHDDAEITIESSPAMPRLATLAKRGAWSNKARTPVPEASKSLFGIQCGRMPLWQPDLRESSEEVTVGCLGNALIESGYATGFFQSEIGAYNDRPRLVEKLGFEHFEAWENLQGASAGDRASDDLSIAPAFDRWVKSVPVDQPLFATVLTSGPSHPFVLPETLAREQRARGVDVASLAPEARHRLLVQRQDELLGALLDTLGQRRAARSGIVVVVGNRGVGFSKRDVKGLVDNPYEEALRVPFVIAGPSVRLGELHGNTSVLDVAPTLAELLGFRLSLSFDELTGRSVLRGNAPNRVFLFSCYHAGACAGTMRWPTKMVTFPTDAVSYAFDLEKDPVETQPSRVWPSAEPALREVQETLETHRISRQPETLAEIELEPGWKCAAGKPCRHPNTPAGRSFKQNSDD